MVKIKIKKVETKKETKKKVKRATKTKKAKAEKKTLTQKVKKRTLKKESKGNYAFIDGNNLYWGVKSQGWKLDYKKFRVLLKEKYNVEKAFLFIGYAPGNELMYKYFQDQGYICIFKPTLKISTQEKEKIKGNIDADLVLYAMIEFPNYDKAIIVSGDGDFYSLIDYLVKHNKLLKIIVPSPKYSSLLRKFSPFIVNISSFRKKIEYKK